MLMCQKICGGWLEKRMESDGLVVRRSGATSYLVPSYFKFQPRPSINLIVDLEYHVDIVWAVEPYHDV